MWNCVESSSNFIALPFQPSSSLFSGTELMFYYVHVCTAQRGHGSELGCINKWSNINKNHHQLMHQRQINKMSRRQIYMLGSSALEQPFCLRVRFFFMKQQHVLYYLSESVISFCLRFCSVQRLMWDFTLVWILLLCRVKFLFAWSVQLTTRNELLLERPESKAFLYGFSHKSLMQFIIRRGWVLPLILQSFLTHLVW